jgi:hypothetical protein
MPHWIYFSWRLATDRPHKQKEKKTMRTRLGLVAALLLAATVAGCGKAADSDNAIATASGARSSSTGGGQQSDQGKALKFVQCMRDQGIEMDDPQNGEIPRNLPEGTDPEKAKAASDKCKKYAPSPPKGPATDPAQVEAMRQVAKCMRGNGVPNFPDPDADGALVLEEKSGINTKDPKVQAAQKLCEKYAPKPPSGAPVQQPGSNG